MKSVKLSLLPGRPNNVLSKLLKQKPVAFKNYLIKKKPVVFKNHLIKKESRKIFLVPVNSRKNLLQRMRATRNVLKKLLRRINGHQLKLLRKMPENLLRRLGEPVLSLVLASLLCIAATVHLAIPPMGDPVTKSRMKTQIDLVLIWRVNPVQPLATIPQIRVNLHLLSLLAILVRRHLMHSVIRDPRILVLLFLHLELLHRQ